MVLIMILSNVTRILCSDGHRYDGAISVGHFTSLASIMSRSAGHVFTVLYNAFGFGDPTQMIVKRVYFKIFTMSTEMY